MTTSAGVSAMREQPKRAASVGIARRRTEEERGKALFLSER
jgi:hypothetical protein